MDVWYDVVFNAIYIYEVRTRLDISDFPLKYSPCSKKPAISSNKPGFSDNSVVSRRG